MAKPPSPRYVLPCGETRSRAPREIGEPDGFTFGAPAAGGARTIATKLVGQLNWAEGGKRGSSAMHMVL